MRSKEIIGVAVLGLFFLAAAFLAERFQEDITTYLDFGYWGMAVYILVCILATVVAPLSAAPLIPAAVVLWGPVATALLSILGWLAGSVVAFIIARRLGRPFVARFVSLKRVERYEKVLGERYLFWNIVLLRMIIPADILSYAIGIFTRINMGAYVLATLIGITPFAFVLPYLSQISFRFQLIAGAIIVMVLYIGHKRIRKSLHLDNLGIK